MILGLVGRILTLPYSLPKAGIVYCLERVVDMAEQEYDDDSGVKDELLRLQLALEEGEIDEAEHRRREAPLLVRLREIRARRRAAVEAAVAERRAEGQGQAVEIELPEELR